MWIQVWHHFEHLLLLVQALTGAYLLGRQAPTSIAQLVFPRVELHLFYNAIVFVPMVVAMVLHRRPRSAEAELMRCACARDADRRDRLTCPPYPRSCPPSCSRRAAGTTTCSPSG